MQAGQGDLGWGCEEERDEGIAGEFVVKGRNGLDLHMRMRTVKGKSKEPVGMVDRYMARRKHDTLELRRQKYHIWR